MLLLVIWTELFPLHKQWIQSNVSVPAKWHSRTCQHTVAVDRWYGAAPLPCSVHAMKRSAAFYLQHQPCSGLNRKLDHLHKSRISWCTAAAHVRQLCSVEYLSLIIVAGNWCNAAELPCHNTNVFSEAAPLKRSNIPCMRSAVITRALTKSAN